MINIRPSTPDEIPLQKDLWKKCFGDSDAYIDIFYQKFCTAEQVLVVEDEGEIDSMLAVLPSSIAFPDGTSAPVGYVYALSTSPYMQGKGHARQLLRYADEFMQKRGMKAMTLVPASPSLHRFFENVGMEECFSTRKYETLSSGLTGDTAGGTMTPIAAQEYNQIRERYLKDTFHVTYTDHMIHFQQIGSHLGYGDIYRIEIGDEVGCVAIEYVQKRRLLVKELLISPDKMQAAVEVIASQLPASRYHIRTPAFWEGIAGSYIQAFAMIKWYDQDLHAKWFSHHDAYMGLGFD